MAFALFAPHSKSNGTVGQFENTGGVVSSCAIVAEQVAVFPQASVAVQVRVIVKVVPQPVPSKTSTKVTIGVAPQASVTVGSTQTGVAPHAIGVVCAAQVIDGGVVSSNVIVAEQVAVFPQASVAVQVRVVDAFTSQPGVFTSSKVTTGVSSQSSVTDGSTQTAVVPHSKSVVCAAHTIVGGVTSCTTIDAEQVAVFP